MRLWRQSSESLEQSQAGQELLQSLHVVRESLTVEIVDVKPEASVSYLLWNDSGLSFVDENSGAKPLTLHLDFINDKQNYSRFSHRGKNELIAKAIGMSKGYRHVIDLTLGLAQDAWFLTELGAQVVGFERSPLVYLLVSDAQRRARTINSTKKHFLFSAYANSLQLLQKQVEKPQTLTDFLGQYLSNSINDKVNDLNNVKENNLDLWGSVDWASTVLYLDPMFPEKNKTALPRKEMQIFRGWVGADADSLELLKLAMQLPVDRIVVKRPMRAEPLLDKVTHSFIGKTVRYDLYGGLR